MPWTVEYFEEDNSRQPAEDFEDALPPRLAGKLARIAMEIQVKGHNVGGGFIEPCHDYEGLWEIRVSLGKQLAREFFGFDKNRAVLLHGIVKSEGHATPKKAFTEAFRYWKQYLKSRKISPMLPEDKT